MYSISDFRVEQYFFNLFTMSLKEFTQISSKVNNNPSNMEDESCDKLLIGQDSRPIKSSCETTF